MNCNILYKKAYNVKMFEWVLVLYLDDSRQYIGNFESCAHATQYFQECVKGDLKSWSTACLHQDYVQLPEGFIPKYPKCK
jgi:hypothetical protein